MFIKFQCGCGHKFRTQPQNAGKKIVCPNCLVKVVIPDPDADSPRLSESEDAVSRNPDAKSPLRGKAATPEIPSRANDRKLAADDDDSRKEAQQRKKRKIKAETPADLDSNSFDLSNVGPMEAEAEAIDDDENVEEFESLRPRKRKTAAGKGDNKSAKKSDKKKPTNREPRKMTGVLIGGLIAGVVLMGIVGFVVVPPLIRNGAGGKKAKAPWNTRNLKITTSHCGVRFQKDGKRMHVAGKEAFLRRYGLKADESKFFTGPVFPGPPFTTSSHPAQT